MFIKQVGQNHLETSSNFFDRRQGVILEEVGLGKVVESVREQVEGPVMLMMIIIIYGGICGGL